MIHRVFIVWGLVFTIGVGMAAAVEASPQAANQASGPGVDAQTLQSAWQRVQQAATPAQQAYEVRHMMQVTAEAGVRADGLTADARDIASGRVAPLTDPAVLQRPQAYEVTVVIDSRFYTFRPLSRASIEPLIGR